MHFLKKPPPTLEAQSLGGIKVVMSLSGIGRNKIYELIKAGKFPQPIKIAPRKNLWVLYEVLEWRDTLIRQRDEALSKSGDS